MVRTAPQGLEVFRPMANPEEPNKAVMTIDYYSVEVTEDPTLRTSYLHDVDVAHVPSATNQQRLSDASDL